MSGGIAYLFNERGIFDEKKFNLEMVELEDLQDSDKENLKELIQNHLNYTKSKKANEIIKNWSESSSKFIKVMPTDYKRALQMLAEEKIEKSI